MERYLTNNKESFVIISAELSTLTPKENELRTRALQRNLDYSEIPYKKVTGVYKGTEEVSFLVITAGVPWPLVEQFKQESALFVGKEREAILHYNNSFKAYGDIKFPERVGTFQVVSEARAKQQDCYTYDHEKNLYYICE